MPAANGSSGWSARGGHADSYPVAIRKLTAAQSYSRSTVRPAPVSSATSPRTSVYGEPSVSSSRIPALPRAAAWVEDPSTVTSAKSRT
jgi:hypothetical protein